MNPPPTPAPRNPRTIRRILGGAASIAMIAVLAGCPKPPPPPPPAPAPPPPPPPPPEFVLSELAQEAKADARVQFPDGMIVSDEAFGRAVIALASAVAKGDADTLGKSLSAPAQSVLSKLESTGEWADATKGIEAVRVVYAGSYDAGEIAAAVASSGAGGSGAALGQIDPTILATIKELIDNGAGEGALEAANQTMPGLLTPEQLASLRAAVKAAEGKSNEELFNMISRAAAGQPLDAPADEPSDMGDSVTSSRGVLIAIQDARGSYLLGWAAANLGDRWVFANTPAAEGDRPRAANWDGVGIAGFSGGSLAMRDDPAARDDSRRPGAPDQDTGADTESDSRSPGKKNTPGGPVTIPGSGSAQ